MKSLVLSIIVILLTSMSVHAQTQEEIEEALRYYPLEVGNYWEYRYHPYNSNESVYYSIEVVSDTTFSNGQTYKKLRSVNLIDWLLPYHEFDFYDDTNGLRVAYFLERICESTGNVYQWNPQSENEFHEVMIDSLLIGIGEQTSSIRFPYFANSQFVETARVYHNTFELFEEQHQVKFFEIVLLHSVYYLLAENFGLVQVLGVSSYSDLIYFRDHLGNEYGEAVNVSTPPTPEVPQRAALLANYPNPFNPTTTIPYELAQAGHVRLEVYDMLGRRVALLVNETRQSGQHSAVFEAANLPSGLYITRLQTADQVFTQKMMLVK